MKMLTEIKYSFLGLGDGKINNKTLRHGIAIFSNAIGKFKRKTDSALLKYAAYTSGFPSGSVPIGTWAAVPPAVAVRTIIDTATLNPRVLKDVLYDAPKAVKNRFISWLLSKGVRKWSDVGPFMRRCSKEKIDKLSAILNSSYELNGKYSFNAV